MLKRKLPIVAPDFSILDVMRIVDASGTQLAIIVGEGDRVIGLATDGDIRRALLRGEKLDQQIDQVMRRDFTTALDSDSDSRVLEIMKARDLRQIPIVDSDGRLVDLKIFEGLVASPEHSNWVVIMAGGEGKRLRPLTNEIPKPMLPVGDRPILQTLVERLVGQGFRRLFLAVNYRAEQIEQHFGDGSQWGARIEYLREPTKLGTAGALGLLPETPDVPIVVMNGDVLAKVSFGDLLGAHVHAGASATMGVREYLHRVPFGVVELDHNRHVVGIEEKPEYRHWVNAGMYVLSPSSLALIAPDQTLDMPTLFDRILAEGGRVAGYPIEEYWIDIGRVEDFHRAHSEYPSFFG